MKKYIEVVTAKCKERYNYEITASEILIDENGKKIVRQEKCHLKQFNSLFGYKISERYTRAVVSAAEYFQLHDFNKINCYDIDLAIEIANKEAGVKINKNAVLTV